MPSHIEDYAPIGNIRTAALVARDGSIDWMCVPRFDSPGCFAALLGQRKHGHIAPVGRPRAVRRRYRDRTLILETEIDTDDGTVRLLDCMPLWPERLDIVRIVEGVRGRVPMRMELIMRFGYGVVIPWVHRVEGAAANGCARSRHDGGNRTRAPGRWAGDALSADESRRRLAAAGGSVSALLVLARRRASARRPKGGRRGAVRATARAPQ